MPDPIAKKLKKSLSAFTDKVLLHTVLYRLSDADARYFLNLLVGQRFSEAEQLINKKIPDLEELTKRELNKRLKNLFPKRNQ